MSDNNISRKDFLKGTAMGIAGGTVAAMGLYSYSPLRKQHFAAKTRKLQDFGVCKSIKITNITETSWFDNANLMGDIKKAGGLLVNQYSYNWPPFGNGKGLGKGSYAEGITKIKHLLPDKLDDAWEIVEKNCVSVKNAGGFAALIEMEEMDGRKRKFLLDSGWSYKWMDECFKREGIDKMLTNGEIEAFILSHEHFDHFWGFPVVMKYRPDITVYIPQGFYPEGLQYIKDCGHKGKLIVNKYGLNKIIPGFATYAFDIPIICRVYGEQSLYFNVKDRGIVSVTGCCHQGIIQFADTAFKEMKY
jgi:7,8-dihydropterin-6-yl-methyl-4-(beta-D-ribofuranosyl)aminobenzene 5'-phosphate synthase